MKTWKFVLSVCALAAILGVAGCSSDDDPVQLPTVLNEAYVGAMMDEFVGPMVDTVTQAGFLLLDLQAPKEPGCTPINDLCASGTAEYCPGMTSTEVIFDQCVIDEWTFDGTITVSPAGVGVYSAVFDVELNGVPIAGLVTLDLTQPPCVYEVYDNFSMTDSGITASMTGGLTVCTTSDYPTGQITLWVTDPTLGLLRIVMDADGTAVISMTIYDLSDVYQGQCDYNIDTEAISCVFD